VGDVFFAAGSVRNMRWPTSMPTRILKPADALKMGAIDEIKEALAPHRELTGFPTIAVRSMQSLHVLGDQANYRPRSSLFGERKLQISLPSECV
jgi:hypothetical protein